MNVLLAGYFVLNFFFILLNGAMAGGGGIASTQLTLALSSTATTMQVADTSGFLNTDVITVDNEYIAYNGKSGTTFDNLVRSYNGSTATSHRAGKAVYTQETSMLNATLGFNVASTAATSGAFTVLALGVGFFTHVLLNLVIWNFPNIFQGQLVYFRILLICIGSALVIYIAINYLLPAMGILKKA